jgi:hypothetical protein
MTRHVLLPAKLSERLRGRDGKFKHKFLEREASITVGYTRHVVTVLYIPSV